MTQNGQIVYMDTIGCLTTIKGKVPRDIVKQFSKVMEYNRPELTLHSKISVVNPKVLPRQEGNDCGPCVNYLATMFARDHNCFHNMLKATQPSFQFPPSHELRIDQAKELFDYLMPEV